MYAIFDEDTKEYVYNKNGIILATTRKAAWQYLINEGYIKSTLAVYHYNCGWVHISDLMDKKPSDITFDEFVDWCLEEEHKHLADWFSIHEVTNIIDEE